LAVVDVQLEVALTPRQVQALAEHTRVAIFSARAADPVVQHLLAAGACAALDKSTPLATRDAVLREACTRPLIAGAPSTAAPVRTSDLDLLSPRERDISLALVRCQTPKEVAASFGLARSTVDCHIDGIRQKLGVEMLQELVALDLASDRP
jgi:DNA-binding NarL/FixJ family response regulator